MADAHLHELLPSSPASSSSLQSVTPSYSLVLPVVTGYKTKNHTHTPPPSREFAAYRKVTTDMTTRRTVGTASEKRRITELIIGLASISFTENRAKLQCGAADTVSLALMSPCESFIKQQLAHSETNPINHVESLLITITFCSSSLWYSKGSVRVRQKDVIRRQRHA
uniref:Uncharacterized protein n=1 Tax=Steinernema glaseri TaxID=37863 RepID=A0A1I7YNC3_9BILA